MRDQIAAMTETARSTAAEIERSAQAARAERRAAATDGAAGILGSFGKLEGELTIIMRHVAKEADGLRARLDRAKLASSFRPVPTRPSLEGDAVAIEAALTAASPPPAPAAPTATGVPVQPAPAPLEDEAEEPEAVKPPAEAPAQVTEEAPPAPVSEEAPIAEQAPAAEGAPGAELSEEAPEAEEAPAAEASEGAAEVAEEPAPAEPAGVEAHGEGGLGQAPGMAVEAEGAAGAVETAEESEAQAPEAVETSEAAECPEAVETPEGVETPDVAETHPAPEADTAEQAVAEEAAEPAGEGALAEPETAPETGARISEADSDVAAKSDLELSRLYSLATARATADDEDAEYWLGVVRMTVQEAAGRSQFGALAPGESLGGRRGKKRRLNVLRPLAEAREEELEARESREEAGAAGTSPDE